MVVTCPVTADTGIEHDRTGCPSRWTVHAPHRAMPQPNLVPVRPSVSRSTHNNGMSGSTSISVSLPLTLSLVIAPPALEHPANQRCRELARAHRPRHAYYTAGRERRASFRP